MSKNKHNSWGKKEEGKWFSFCHQKKGPTTARSHREPPHTSRARRARVLKLKRDLSRSLEAPSGESDPALGAYGGKILPSWWRICGSGPGGYIKSTLQVEEQGEERAKANGIFFFLDGCLLQVSGRGCFTLVRGTISPVTPVTMMK